MLYSALTGTFQDLITSTQEVRFIGSFIAEVFFVSVFTAAPATVALGEIAQSNSALTVAIIGGLGALEVFSNAPVDALLRHEAKATRKGGFLSL